MTAEKTQASLQTDFWIDAWQKEMQHTPYIADKIRSENEASAFWGECASSYTYDGLPRLVSKVITILRQEEVLGPDKEILDIGCGPGNYALPFAEHGKRVVALDSSAGMLAALEAKAEHSSLHNISIQRSLWDDLDLGAHNMQKAFDLVFASMTPAICDYASLIKMHEASREHCCLVTWAGVPVDTDREELWHKVMGNPRKSGAGFDMIYPFNILYSLGCCPLLRYVKINREEKLPIDHVAARLRHYFWLFTRLTPEIEQTIDRYLEKRAINGLYCREINEVLGILIWRPPLTGCSTQQLV